MQKQQTITGSSAFIPLLLKLVRFLGGLFVVVGIIIFFIGSSVLYGQWQSTDWVSVKGQIVEGGFNAPRGEDEDRAVVEYMLEGKRHRHTVNYRPHHEPLEIDDLDDLRRYMHGARVEVYYDPAESSQLIDQQKQLYARESTALVIGFAPDAFDFLIPALLTIAIGPFFANVLYHMLQRGEQSFTATMHAQKSNTERVTVDTERGRYEHVEISPEEDEEAIPFVRENARGVVLFDSTQRPMRLWGAGFGMLLWLIVFVALYFMKPAWGTFEYLILGGWAAWALLVAGFVYEVRIDIYAGTATKKIGWFFIADNKSYQLQEFNRVLMETYVPPSEYDNISERQQRSDPKFTVVLDGERSLDLRAFDSIGDARRMAQEVGEYLKLPVEDRQNSDDVN